MDDAPPNRAGSGRTGEKPRLTALEAENARLRAELQGLSGDSTVKPAAGQDGAETDYFRVLADNIPQLAWMADASGGIVWYNRRWYDYTGTTPEQMLGWGWKSVHHPDHVDGVEERFTAAIEAGDAEWEDTFPLRSASGDYRWFLSRAAPILGEDGKVARWVGTNTDITEQLAAEEALREAEERRRLATEAAQIGSWDFDPQSRVLLWDARCREIFGIDPDREASVDVLTELIHPDDREETLQALRRALSAGGDDTYFREYRIRHGRTGEERWVASRGLALFENGAPARLVGTVLDITERKIADHQQALLINELNHRVKNTLANVQALVARTLRSAPDTEAARKALTARLLTLSAAHDILTAESWEGADMADMVRSAIKPWRETAGDRFEISGPLVRISPKKALALSMALNELATNAVKYGALSVEGGTVRVEWDWYQGEESRRLKLVWRETGGPEVRPPKRAGFGSRLIQQGLAGQLDADVSLDYRPEGVVCSVDAPLLHVDRKTPQ